MALLALCLATCSCAHSARQDIDCVPGCARVLPLDRARLTYEDGDSFLYDGVGIRVLGMDAPEIAHPEHGFPVDQPHGREATTVATALMQDAGELAYLPIEVDPYGRMLAHVFIDGELLSIRMIEAGLAYETVSHFGANGCPQLAMRIMQAARQAPPPDFIRPYEWRKANKVEPDPALPADGESGVEPAPEAGSAPAGDAGSATSD